MNRKLMVSILLVYLCAIRVVGQEQNTTKEYTAEEYAQAESDHDSLWSKITGKVIDINIWNEYVAQPLKNAALSKHVNTPSANLGSFGTLFGTFGIRSEPSMANTYIGTDTWSLNLEGTVYSNKNFAISNSFQREYTFIQQYNSRMESLKRLPYNPITKLPLTAIKAKELKVGDFFGYRAPMVLSLGRGLLGMSGDRLQENASISVYIMGEMDVHIYRMPDNNVRVRILTVKDTAIQASTGFTFIGINLLLNKVIDLHPLQVSFLTKKSNSFSFDYVFDLNNQEAASAYDEVIGQKISIKEIIRSSLEIAQSNSKLAGRLALDLTLVNNIAIEDANKRLEDRRVIRLSKSENETLANSFTLSGNFFSLFKLSSSKQDAESNITLFDIRENKNHYFIQTLTENTSSKFFNLFSQQTNKHQGILISSDADGKMQSIIGLQNLLQRDELKFNREKMVDFKMRMEKILPEEIVKTIKLPDLSHLGEVSISNAKIVESLAFNEVAMENLHGIDYYLIQKELRFLIKNWGSLQAEPMNTVRSDDGSVDVRKHYLNEGNYEKAYSYEDHYIPTYLTKLMDKNANINDRLDAYNHLIRYELFKELGSALMIRLIPENKLKDCVSFTLQITGRGIEQTAGSVYPKNADLTKTYLFNQIVDQNSYAMDRSYNLRLYQNEDGTSFTRQQLVEKFK